MATITGTYANDTLYGTAAADIIYGLGGNDFLLGGEGRDSLYGGDGNDRLRGDGYQDYYDGGAGFDLVDFIGTPSAVSASLATGLASFIGMSWPAESMVAIEGLVGTILGDSLTGDAGDNYLEGGAGRDSLFGGDGDDVLWGGAGNDVLDGGAGFDVALYHEVTRTLRVEIATGLASFPGATRLPEILTGIEGVESGSGADVLLGDAGANLFRGGAGNDSLAGWGGNDTLDGGTGQDTIRGGAGDDVIVIDPSDGREGLVEGDTLTDDGRDTIDGGAGTDTVVVENEIYAQEPLGSMSFFVTSTVNLAAGTLALSHSAFTDKLLSIENVVTADGSDTITGSAGDNYIAPGHGANVVHGGAGDDTIDGGFRVWDFHDSEPIGEVLDGGAGNDVIRGNGSELLEDNGFNWWIWTGEDTLIGGAGDDALYHGAGRAVMTGGTGADAFHFTDEVSWLSQGDYGGSVYGRRTITDFDGTDGDHVFVEMIGSDADVTFVGAAAAADLDILEAGYTVEDGDTVLRIRMGWYDETDILEIAFDDYTGPLTPDELTFA